MLDDHQYLVTDHYLCEVVLKLNQFGFFKPVLALSFGAALASSNNYAHGVPPDQTSTLSMPAPSDSDEQGAVVGSGYVCAGQTVPSGQVITSIDYSNCGSIATWNLSTPYSGIYVCSNSPIPSPYVIPYITPVNYCAGLNAYELETPISGTYVCSNSPIPSPFGVTAVWTGTIDDHTGSLS